MGYRDVFFAHNKGHKRLGKSGTWYRCVSCGKWFSKSNITVDHIIPKRKGGTDDIWNLQPMCRSCNSAKCDRNTGFETGRVVAGAVLHGQVGKLAGSMAKRKVKDMFGVPYRR